MASQLPWSRLVPGIIALVVLAAATIALLLFGSVGGISGDKMRLYIVTNSARGVMRGTEVWLSGQKVGVVENVSFRSPDTDTISRVVIAMDVREADAGQIRRDSEIRVRAGANLVGPIVVYVSAGTPAGAAVRDGDTLYGPAQTDLPDAIRRLGDARKELGPLASDARAVLSHVRDPGGSIGAFMRGGTRDLSALWSGVGAFRTRLDSASGPRVEFVANAKRALAQMDSIRVLLRDDRASLGRFRRDSTLGRTIARVRDEIAAARARLEDNDGALGRFAADSAIQHALASAQAELSLLMEDIRKRPLRYIAF